MTMTPMMHSTNVLKYLMAQGLFSLVLVAVIVVNPANHAVAGEFLGVEVDSFDRTYLVMRDVNVRSKPDTKSKRVDGLKKGSKVRVVGRHQGWLAIMEDGKPLGFAYFKYLQPLVDGELQAPLQGTAVTDSDGKCSYTIEFTGKSTAGNESFSMADYDIHIRCERNGVSLSFMMFMFLTESAYRPSKPDLHQIGIDLLEIDTFEEYDNTFTTNIFYNLKKEKVVFSDISIGAYAGKPESEEQDVATVSEALSVAVRMALESWNGKAWDDLTAAIAEQGN